MACFITNTSFIYGNRTTKLITTPYNLFGWNIGKSKNDDISKTKYYDIDLPFSLSLVDKTFLKGTLSSFLMFIDNLKTFNCLQILYT